MRKPNDDPKGNKKKVFQSSGSPSKAQRTVQGPAVAAAIGLGTAAAGLIAKKKKPFSDKLEAKADRQYDKANRQAGRSEKLSNRAEKVSEYSPAKSAKLTKRSDGLKDKSSRLYTESSANKKVASEIRKLNKGK